jgi:formate dehydrogenase subunit gamma
MKVSGGYPQKILQGKEIDVPPMDKMNSGQKIFGICLLFGGTFLIVSGWMLYAFLPFTPKAFSFLMDFGHLYIGLFLGMFMFTHILLGIYNWGEFKAMFGDGTQPLEEAKHHNPIWVQNKIEPAGQTISGGKSQNISN